LRQAQCNESSSLHAVSSPLSRNGTTEEWKTLTRGSGLRCLYRAVLQQSPQPLLFPVSPSVFSSLIQYVLSISSSLFMLLRCSSGFFDSVDAHLFHSVPQSLPYMLTFETFCGYLCPQAVCVYTHTDAAATSPCPQQSMCVLPTCYSMITQSMLLIHGWALSAPFPAVLLSKQPRCPCLPCRLKWFQRAW